MVDRSRKRYMLCSPFRVFSPWANYLCENKNLRLLRRKLGSESVKTQFSKIYFSQMYFLMAMDSYAYLSGVSPADILYISRAIYLTGYISR
jgi:hypothetical protein